MSLRDAAQQALEFCEFLWREVAMNDYAEERREATEASLRAALSEPKSEPVAWVSKHTLDRIKDFDGTIYANGGFDDAVPLYTRPPQRQPLTDEQIEACYETAGHYQSLRPQDRFVVFALARAIERAHGIGGDK